MPEFIGRPFALHPKLAATISRLIAGFTEIELELVTCVEKCLHRPFSAFRSFYRLKSEINRVDLADALIFPILETTAVAGFYGTTIGDIRICKDIRNQYAHCYWRTNADQSKLMFTIFEPTAKSSTSTDFKFYEVTAHLLENQEAFFNYTRGAVQHLELALAEIMAGQPLSNISQPQRPQPPPKQNPALKILNLN